MKTSHCFSNVSHFDSNASPCSSGSFQLTCCSKGPNEALWRHRSQFNICHLGSDGCTYWLHHLLLPPRDFGVRCHVTKWKNKRLKEKRRIFGINIGACVPLGGRSIMFGYKVRVIWNKQKQILRRRMRGKAEKARWEGRMKELSSLKGTLVSLLEASKCWFLARQRAARPGKGGWWQGRRLKFELWNKTDYSRNFRGRFPTIYISVLEVYSRVKAFSDELIWRGKEKQTWEWLLH